LGKGKYMSSGGRLLFSYKREAPKGGEKAKILNDQWIPQIARDIKILNPDKNPTIGEKMAVVTTPRLQRSSPRDPRALL